MMIILLLFLSSQLRDAAAAWTSASATFYGGSDGSGTMGGACGYGNLYSDGYGINNAALSTVLFNNGATCGSCYQIVCDAGKAPQWCRKDKYITVTATNFCPPTTPFPTTTAAGATPAPTFRHVPACVGDHRHIQAGIVPILYQRVSCKRSGGMRFTINGRDYFELVLVTNVAGAGDVAAMWIKGSRTGWQVMTRNWGTNWQSLSYLNGQSLSFRVQLSDGQVRTANNVAPSNWRFGQTYATSVQF
ncbi:unnamed protein product [Spirodela intermedia]|uniref:Expansin n=1 Tax=Spirodela intermedia TaxID=51605 RepID=A0A7I8IWJ7_SPIIN|nr:unnamed protein product [Spirodela intermedia]CAA6662239.1 unnamed protein product [Spirodela intermedia]